MTSNTTDAEALGEAPISPPPAPTQRYGGALLDLDTRVSYIESLIRDNQERSARAERDNANRTLGFVVGAVWGAIVMWSLRR